MTHTQAKTERASLTVLAVTNGSAGKEVAKNHVSSCADDRVRNPVTFGTRKKGQGKIFPQSKI